MLSIFIPERELFDDTIQEFFKIDSILLNFEHSLISISKWEDKYKKPFLQKSDRTEEEMLDYLYFMITNDNIKKDSIRFLTKENVIELNKYISDAHTATTFSNEDINKSSREIITSELVYYWMVSLNIPFECQYWNFNRLMTLIRICNIKNGKPKKQRPKKTIEDNHRLNEERKKKLGTRG